MRKFLFCVSTCTAFALSGNAQFVDTLAGHFTGSTTLGTSADDQGNFGGYICGTNNYLDKAKLQLFDAKYGAGNDGIITNVLVYVAVKGDNGGSFDVKIWENGPDGKPGAELGTVTIPLAQVDTSLAGYTVGSDFAFNVNAAFNVAVPANHSFWAGITIPETAGDTIAILSSEPFADSLTHSGEFWSDDTFHFMSEPQPDGWEISLSFGVFPVVNLIADVAELNDMEAVVYPNPAENTLNFNVASLAATFEVLSLDGKSIMNIDTHKQVGSIDISTLESGMYLYKITDINGMVATRNFVKK